MKKLLVMGILMGLWTLHMPAQAQDVYPCSGPGPGETVVGMTPEGNGVASVPLCRKIDRGSSVAPPARWESRWGAIATDGRRSALGTATGMTTKEFAEASALRDCQAKGGEHCEIDVSYDNSCAAMVTGDHGYNVRTGRTAEDAVSYTLAECRSSNQNCRVYYQNCSPAQRVQ